MWRFTTRLGTFRIQELPNSRYGLYMDTELLGSYHSPQGATEAVYSCTTGHYGWDSGGPVIVLRDLSDWEHVGP